LHYGDYILIQHQSTGTTIATDPSIDTNPPHQQFLIVGSNEKRPLARNTFRIMKPPLLQDQDDQYEYDDIVRYGSPFLLACNDSLLVSDDGYCMNPSLYLSSLQRNYRTATRITNKQAVYLTSQCNAEAIWIAALPSHGKAIDWGNKYRGDPILSGDLFLLKHRQTNTCLTINTTEGCQTDYGYELEVITSPDTSVGKLSLVEYELAGLGTSQTLRKPDLQCHEIMFVTASHPKAAIDHRNLPITRTAHVGATSAFAMTSAPSVRSLLEDLAASIRSLGLLAFVDLRRQCLDIDRGGRYSSTAVPTAGGAGRRGGEARGEIDLIDFKNLLEQRGIICESYYDELFEVFRVQSHPPEFPQLPPKTKAAALGLSRPPPPLSSYEINYRQLIARLRGKLSSKRSQYLTSLYQHLLSLSHTQSNLAVRELCGRFRADRIPVVSEGKLSPEQFRVKYLERVLDSDRGTGGIVCVAEEGFVSYWSDFNPLLETDEEFELFVEDCCGL
jgi:hypothetical protein